MKKSPGRSHSPLRLSASLNQQLNLYALAASAAGVSLLALAAPAEAKIIYTKTHQDIGTNGISGLDLNHDGTMDFVIQALETPSFFTTWGGSGGNALYAKEAFGNAVEGSIGRYSRHFASALKKGTLIGPSQDFISSSSSRGAVMFGVGCNTTSCWTSGQWLNVRDRYLGLKFQIDGKTHYGWARLSVQLRKFTITGTLTGYAYETAPNKGIYAGHTRGAANEGTVDQDGVEWKTSAVTALQSASQIASLARLAHGARSVPLWRRP